MPGDVGTDRPHITSTNVSLNQPSPSRPKHARTRSFSQPDPFDPNPQILGRVREASKTTGVPTETILQSISHSYEQSTSSSTLVEWSMLLPYVESLPPSVQHDFNHWCHIRCLYERQYAEYRSTGQLLPITIDTHTERQEQGDTVTLTTSTCTTMPHGMAQTNTSTTYTITQQLVLPPSPPLISQTSQHVFQPPFSPLFTYPSHPFSCPPPVIVQALERSLLERLMKTCALSCNCAASRSREQFASIGRGQQLPPPSFDRSISHTDSDRSRARTLIHAGSNESQTSDVSSSEDEDDNDIKMG